MYARRTALSIISSVRMHCVVFRVTELVRPLVPKATLGHPRGGPPRSEAGELAAGRGRAHQDRGLRPLEHHARRRLHETAKTPLTL